MPWDSFFARRTGLTTRSPIRELLKFTIQPEVISFAGGLPAPELFPVRAHAAGAGADIGAPLRRIARQQHHEAGVVDDAVGIFERCTEWPF